MLFNSSMVASIIKSVFPDCKKRQVSIIPAETFSPSGNYWDSGYRNYYGIVELSTLRGMVLPSDNPLCKINDQVQNIKPGFVVVKHTYSGMREYVTIYAHPQNMPVNLNGPEEELSDNELAVLYFTRSRKSSYAGVKNYRFHSFLSYGGKLTEQEWESVKAGLITKKLLMKNGALSITGKNRADKLDWDYTNGKVASR